MTRRAWHRLISMQPREIAGRVGMAARTHLDRWAWHLRAPAWRRELLARQLDPRVPAVRRAARLLTEGDAARAHRVLSGHYVWRAPRFVLTPHARDGIARIIRARFPSAVADARRRADRALEGCLDVLGYRGLSFAAGPNDRRIDWLRDPVHDRRAPHVHWSRVPFLDPVVGDHKIVWELNRHQHWLTLGRAYWLTRDPRYRAGFIEQLEGWLDANPPRTGINWASMLELGFRALSWIWALHLFVECDEQPTPTALPPEQEPPWTLDLLAGLHAQLQLIEQHLSTYFSPNTHLLGEGLALYVAGRSLPELRASSRWARIGRNILLGEADRQIHPDGGHAELSAHYHRYTLDFYVLALAIARATDDAEARAPLEQATERLARFAHILSDRHFQLPQIGDDDGGQLLPMCGGSPRDVGPSLAVAAAVLRQPELSDGRPHEEVAWMTGTIPVTTPTIAPRRSAWLRETGYVVSHTPRGDHLVMDVGRLGYLNAGHGHADALSLTLTVAGRPLLIDPGTGSYTMNRTVRDQLRSTVAHNTITLDGRSQSEPAGPFHWRSRATARLEASRFTSRFDYIEATHDGYGPGGHRRQVLARPGCWIVLDWIGGAAERHLAAHWHLDPAWRVHENEQGRVALRHVSGSSVWLITSSPSVEAYTGSPNGLGWHSPAYGSLQPTTTLRVSLSAVPPFALATAIVEGREPLALEPLAPTPRAGVSGNTVAFRLTGPGWHETIVAAVPLPGSQNAAPGLTAHERFLCVRTSATAPIETWLVDDDMLEDDSGRGAIAPEAPPAPPLHQPVTAEAR